MTTVTPFLWFDGHVREAVDRYLEVFDDAELVESSPGTDGDYFSATLRVHGQDVCLLDGGPHYALSPAFSLFVRVGGQDEIDRLWDALLDGGTALQCGWLTDRFGVTWQIVPTAMLEMFASPDRDAAERAQKAMLTMQKLDLPALQAAFDGG